MKLALHNIRRHSASGALRNAHHHHHPTTNLYPRDNFATRDKFFYIFYFVDSYFALTFSTIEVKLALHNIRRHSASGALRNAHHHHPTTNLYPRQHYHQLGISPSTDPPESSIRVDLLQSSPWVDLTLDSKSADSKSADSAQSAAPLEYGERALEDCRRFECFFADDSPP